MGKRQPDERELLERIDARGRRQEASEVIVGFLMLTGVIFILWIFFG